MFLPKISSRSLTPQPSPARGFEVPECPGLNFAVMVPKINQADLLDQIQQARKIYCPADMEPVITWNPIIGWLNFHFEKTGSMVAGNTYYHTDGSPFVAVQVLQRIFNPNA